MYQILVVSNPCSFSTQCLYWQKIGTWVVSYGRLYVFILPSKNWHTGFLATDNCTHLSYHQKLVHGFLARAIVHIYPTRNRMEIVESSQYLNGYINSILHVWHASICTHKPTHHSVRCAISQTVPALQVHNLQDLDYTRRVLLFVWSIVKSSTVLHDVDESLAHIYRMFCYALYPPLE